MFPLTAGETVIRERARLALDPYSNELTVLDWSTPDLLQIEGTAIAPGTSTEARQVNRAPVTTPMSIYGPPAMDVKPRDRIRARSGLWEVEGEVANWINPFTGWEPGAEFAIKKWEG